MLTLLLMTIVGTGVAINRSFDRIFLLFFKDFPRKMLFSTLFFTNFVCFWNRVKKVSNNRKTSQITCKTWKTWINLSRQTKNMKRCNHTSKNFEKDDKLQKGSKSNKKLVYKCGTLYSWSVWFKTYAFNKKNTLNLEKTLYLWRGLLKNSRDIKGVWSQIRVGLHSLATPGPFTEVPLKKTRLSRGRPASSKIIASLP